MRTVYTHADEGRSLRLQTGTESGEPLARLSLDAPGERAVSHDLDADDLTVLYAAVTDLLVSPPDPVVE